MVNIYGGEILKYRSCTTRWARSRSPNYIENTYKMQWLGDKAMELFIDGVSGDLTRMKSEAALINKTCLPKYIGEVQLPVTSHCVVYNKLGGCRSKQGTWQTLQKE